MVNLGSFGPVAFLLSLQVHGPRMKARNLPLERILRPFRGVADVPILHFAKRRAVPTRTAGLAQDAELTAVSTWPGTFFDLRKRIPV